MNTKAGMVFLLKGGNSSPPQPEGLENEQHAKQNTD